MLAALCRGERVGTRVFDYFRPLYFIVTEAVRMYTHWRLW